MAHSCGRLRSLHLTCAHSARAVSLERDLKITLERVEEFWPGIRDDRR